MDGTIRTKEKCPRCGGAFAGEPLACPACLTAPRRHFVDFPWRGRRLRLYSGPDSHPLDSWERAHRLLTTMRAKADAGTFDPREHVGAGHASLRFDLYAEAWLGRLQRRLELGEISRGYVSEARSVVRRYLKPFFGALSIRDVHEGVVADLRLGLPLTLGPASIQMVLGTLRRILADAFQRRDVARVPAFPRARGSDVLVRWLRREEQDRVVAATVDPTYRALFLFLMKQGVRPSEALALEWAEVDLKAGRVEIRAAMDRGVRRPWTKTHRERALALHPEVIEALRGLPSRFAGGAVFALRGGRPPSHRSVTRAWHKACGAAGAPKTTLYQGTKHSLATQAVNAGVPLEMVAAALGHKDSRATRRYAKAEGAVEELWK